MASVIGTADLHLAYRVVDVMQDEFSDDVIRAAVLAAAAEVLRLAYLHRSTLDPISGQLPLLDD